MGSCFWCSYRYRGEASLVGEVLLLCSRDVSAPSTRTGRDVPTPRHSTGRTDNRDSIAGPSFALSTTGT